MNISLIIYILLNPWNPRNTLFKFYWGTIVLSTSFPQRHPQEVHNALAGPLLHHTKNLGYCFLSLGNYLKNSTFLQDNFPKTKNNIPGF